MDPEAQELLEQLVAKYPPGHFEGRGAALREFCERWVDARRAMAAVHGGPGELADRLREATRASDAAMALGAELGLDLGR